MKDYSQYHYMELYDMLNHINPYKYHDKIDEIRKEIELRKNQGEVPNLIKPRANFSFSDLTDFFLVLFSSYQIVSGLSSIIISLIMIAFVIGEGTTPDFIFVGFFTIASLGLFWGGIKLIRRIRSGIIISFFSYLLQSFTFIIFGLNTFALAFETEVQEVSAINFFPFTNLFFLIVLFYFISKSNPRKLRDVLHDYLTFSKEKIFSETNKDI